MKHFFIISIIYFLFSHHLSAQNEIVGKWKTEDKEAIVKIYKAQNGKYYGKITWLKNPNDANGKAFTDSENPDENLRSEPLVGLTILKSFEYSSEKWRDGTIYNPNEGKTYNCKMWLTDENTLQVRGYWGVLYETETWSKIQ